MKKITHILKRKNIDMARVAWCDLCNVIRAKMFHRNHFKYYLKGIGLTPALGGFPGVCDMIAPETGLAPIGEYWVVPDLRTLRVLPYANHHVSAMGNIIMNDGNPWFLCTRSLLSKMVARLKEFGIDLKVGFENEFYILKINEQKYIPIDNSLYASNDALNMNYLFLDEFTQLLEAQNIGIFCCHAESGNGQYEFSLDHSNPIDACDKQIFFRESLHALSYKHQYISSVLPKIFTDKAGSGCHIHLSLWRHGKNIMAEKNCNTFSKIASHFFAGILNHLDAVMAFTTPIQNSYKRLKPNSWAGAYGAWGIDNRETALRVPTTQQAHFPDNVEIKIFDGAANPYLGLSALIAAGIDGLEKELPLPQAVQQNPALLTEAERKNKKIISLPISLMKALNTLEKDKVLQKILSPELCRIYLAVKKFECAYTTKLNHEQEINLLINLY